MIVVNNQLKIDITRSALNFQMCKLILVIYDEAKCMPGDTACSPKISLIIQFGTFWCIF